MADMTHTLAVLAVHLAVKHGKSAHNAAELAAKLVALSAAVRQAAEWQCAGYRSEHTKEYLRGLPPALYDAENERLFNEGEVRDIKLRASHGRKLARLLEQYGIPQGAVAASNCRLPGLFLTDTNFYF